MTMQNREMVQNLHVYIVIVANSLSILQLSSLPL